jgi:DNA-binding FrmR family transcriptional regulator
VGVTAMKNLKKETIVNFKKAQSHLGKIIKMIEDDEYCVDIMQQVLAVMGLLRSSHAKLMENHLSTCFKKAMESKNEKKKREMIEEILKVSRLFNR